MYPHYEIPLVAPERSDSPVHFERPEPLSGKQQNEVPNAIEIFGMKTVSERLWGGGGGGGKMLLKSFPGRNIIGIMVS